MESTHFLLKVEHKESKVDNTSDHSIPSPLWGAIFTFSLTCWQSDRPLPFGENPACKTQCVSCWLEGEHLGGSCAALGGQVMIFTINLRQFSSPTLGGSR